MKRRSCVKCFGGEAEAILLPGCQQIVAASPLVRPNIFMIVTDDTPQPDHGCYENPHVRTPNIDRLASAGMAFDNSG